MSSIQEKMRQAKERIKKQKESKGGGGSREDFWLKKDVPSQVRILPDSDPEELFILEATIWKIPGFKDDIVDPRSVGRDHSPMQVLYDELKAQNDPSNEKLLGWFKPKTRWFHRLISRNVQEDGSIKEYDTLKPRYFFAPLDIADEIFKLYDDPDYGECIADVTNEGIDFTYLKEGTGLSTTYSATAKRKPSALHSNEEVVVKMMEELEPIHEKLESLVKSDEELEDMLSKMTLDGPADSTPSRGSSMKRAKMDEEEDEEGNNDSAEAPKSRPSASSLKDRMRKRK